VYNEENTVEKKDAAHRFLSVIMIATSAPSCTNRLKLSNGKKFFTF